MSLTRMRPAPFSFKSAIMALIPTGLVVDGKGLPELTTGFMSTASPLESQEKSVADSAAVRTAAKSSASEAPLFTPARPTPAAGPGLRTFSAPEDPSHGMAVAANVRPIIRRKVRRFMPVPCNADLV
jgi:hypothetical protein